MLLGRLMRRGTVALACAGVAVAVAACGSSGSTVSAGTVVRAAYVSTSASGYQLQLAMKVNSSALPQPVTAKGSGAFDVPAHSGSIVLDMNLGSSPQIQQALGSNALRFEELIKGTTVYIKLPDALTSKVPSLSGKPWIKVDIAKAAAASGVPGLASLVSNPAASDPSQLLQYLRAAGGTVTKQGTEVVNGFQTTKYKATISLDRVPNALPPASRAAGQQAIAGIERLTHVHQIPVDVWIDEHSLVRRMQMSLNETVPTTGQSVSTQITVDIVKYGPQPQPPAPGADQVTDISQLTGL